FFETSIFLSKDFGNFFDKVLFVSDGQFIIDSYEVNMTTFVMDTFKVLPEVIFTNEQILNKENIQRVFNFYAEFELVNLYKTHLVKSSSIANLCSPHYFWMELLSIGYPFVKRDLILENPSMIPMVKLIDQYMNWLNLDQKFEFIKEDYLLYFMGLNKFRTKPYLKN
ncbi:hypothetical protein OAX96_03460, partial [Prochlorococcus sp. AH-736-K15]|nr:hypothetical protein [Prochlorococcus sp. AH-736-K15]